MIQLSDFLFSVFPNENFVDLGLYQFGKEQCEPAHSFGPVSRNHYLFHYVLSGTGRLMANDSKGQTQEYQIKSGQGFMIFPKQINTYIADKDLPWEYTWIEFDGLRAKEIIELAGLTPDHPVYHASSKELRELMKNEMLYIAEHGDASPFHLIGHLFLFIDYLSRSSVTMHLSSSGKVRDFYIKEALNYIEQNFQNDISVEGIAQFCGLNRTYFGRIFKAPWLRIDKYSECGAVLSVISPEKIAHAIVASGEGFFLQSSKGDQPFVDHSRVLSLLLLNHRFQNTVYHCAAIAANSVVTRSSYGTLSSSSPALSRIS